MNFQKIVPKLSRTIKSDRITPIYAELLENKFLGDVLKGLDPMDLVKLVFCIDEYKKGNHNLEGILNKINTQLYSFSIAYFNTDDPQNTCDDCGGRGSYSCDYCGGGGSEDCEECDGNGEIEVDRDEDEDEITYETCETCGGGGNVDCSYCDGSGDVTCTTCDGSGEVEYEGHTQFKIESFVGVNLDILNKLQMASNSNLPLDDDFYFYEIRDNSLELSFTEVTPSDDYNTTKSVDQDFRGAFYVNKVSEILDFDMRKYGKTIEITNLDELDDKFLKD